MVNFCFRRFVEADQLAKVFSDHPRMECFQCRVRKKRIGSKKEVGGGNNGEEGEEEGRSMIGEGRGGEQG